MIRRASIWRPRFPISPESPTSRARSKPRTRRPAKRTAPKSCCRVHRPRSCNSTASAGNRVSGSRRERRRLLRDRARFLGRIERHVQFDIEAVRPELELGVAAEIVADALVDELHAEAAVAPRRRLGERGTLFPGQM